MSYGAFLGVFVVLPLLAFAWASRPALRRFRWAPWVVLLLIVYAWASPWDNVAVRAGLWSFGEGKTWGVRLGYLPLEEYLFFGLQTALTGVWCLRRLAKAFPRAPAEVTP